MAHHTADVVAPDGVLPGPTRSGPTPSEATAVATARLRSRGLRVTGPRIAVLGAVAARPHADAEQIAAAVRSAGAAVSRASVYNVLGALTGEGLVRRVEAAGFPARYETQSDDNHHHLVCRGCGRTTDVACVVGSRACLQPQDDHGFTLDEAEVTFWGRCADCRSASLASTPAPPARSAGSAVSAVSPVSPVSAAPARPSHPGSSAAEPSHEGDPR